MTAMVRIKSDERFERHVDELREYWVENMGADENNSGSIYRKAFGQRVIAQLDLLNRHHRLPYLAARNSTGDPMPYRLGLHFSNNNAEAVNSAIKRALNYNAVAAPVLLDTIQTMMSAQNADSFRAIYGTGNYDLVNDKFNMQRSLWFAKSLTSQKKWLYNMLRGEKNPSRFELYCRVKK